MNIIIVNSINKDLLNNLASFTIINFIIGTFFSLKITVCLKKLSKIKIYTHSISFTTEKARKY